MKTARAHRIALLSALLSLLAAPALAGEFMPSVLAFPLGTFPGQGVCQGSVNGDTASQLGLNGLEPGAPELGAPFCAINVHYQFMGNPQYPAIVQLVGGAPVFTLVPEPGTLLLLGVGLVGLASIGSRR